MIKKTNKYILGILSLFIILCSSICIPTFASETISQNALATDSLLKKSNGIVSLAAQSNRNTNYLDMTSYGAGILTISFGANSYGAVVISYDDYPADVEIGYTFNTTDYHAINNVDTITVDFPGYSYVYVSYNRGYTAIYEPSSTPVDPTSTFTPTPTPVITGGGIPLDYDIPFDYYMIAIIILLGGILICQFFKN